jgi:hypothetical protein
MIQVVVTPEDDGGGDGLQSTTLCQDWMAIPLLDVTTGKLRIMTYSLLNVAGLISS